MEWTDYLLAKKYTSPTEEKKELDRKIKDIIKLSKIYDRTKNNIIYYMEEGKANSLLNEIGVLRGIIYAMDEISGKEKEPSDFEKVIWTIQNELKELDETESEDLPFN